MNDMSQVIVPKSDQINADDLIAGPMTITIRDVQIRGGQEQPVSIYMDGTDKAFRPCKSMSRVLVAAWGTDAKNYVGRSLTLYRDPTVKWGGLEVGGIRISHMTDINSTLTLALTATKGSRKPYVVKPLVARREEARGGFHAGAEELIARIEAVDNLPDLAALMKTENAAIDAMPDDVANRVFSIANARKNDLKSKRSSFEEGPADTQRGDAHDDTLADHPARTKADALIAACNNAEVLGSIINVEREFDDLRDIWPDELVGEVVTAIDAGKARFPRGGK